MKITESFVHIAMRQFLKKNDWLLIAGEYPNGSDDELNVLSISDPVVARDNSPDPRRHSRGEIIPDLVAYKNGCILIIEAKPKYSIEDKNKLVDLLYTKKDRLIDSLKDFSFGKPQFSHINYDHASYIPVLAFGNSSFVPPCEDSGFGHIYIRSLDEAMMVFWETPEE